MFSGAFMATVTPFREGKLDETRLSLSFIILDKALPPLRKSRPKRSVALLAAMLGSFVISSIAVIAAANVQLARERFRRDKAALGL